MRYWLPILLATVIQCDAATSAPANAAQIEVAKVADALRTGRVRQVEILHIPDRIETPIRVTPQMLLRQHHVGVTIRDIRRWQHQSGLLKALERTKVREGAVTPDLRWAIHFYDEKQKLIAAFYTDARRLKGTVGDTPVEYSDAALFDFIRKVFGKSLE